MAHALVSRDAVARPVCLSEHLVYKRTRSPWPSVPKRSERVRYIFRPRDPRDPRLVAPVGSKGLASRCPDESSQRRRGRGAVTARNERCQRRSHDELPRALEQQRDNRDHSTGGRGAAARAQRGRHAQRRRRLHEGVDGVRHAAQGAGGPLGGRQAEQGSDGADHERGP
eukprot:4422732-Prymnesium_polylepis.1